MEMKNTERRPTAEPERPRAGGLIALFLVFLAIFVLSPVHQVSDAAYSLLVSECLLRDGTMALDRFVEPPLDPAVHPGSENGELPYQLGEFRGHVYYRYPPGTSVLSLPYVAVSHLVGMSAVYPEGGYHYREERRMQFRLAGLLMAALVLATYLTARCVLSHRWSLVLTAAVALTTQVWSTASRGLWAHSWAILLVAIAILLLVRHETHGHRMHPVLLASALCWAYFTRPTMALPVAIVGVYLALRFRKALVPYAVTVAGWLAVFAAASWWQYGALLPPYFRASRLGTSDFLTGLAGTLVSPSRGLLIFLPHLLVIIWWLVRHGRRSRFAPLAVLGTSVAVAHLLVVASWSQWWGGDSFGPRLMTDAVPWFALMSLVAIDGRLRAHEDRPTGRAGRRVEIAAVAVLSLLALVFNGGGALSAKTNEWNWTPVTVNEDPGRLWDWNDPQFLAPFRDRPGVADTRLD